MKDKKVGLLVCDHIHEDFIYLHDSYHTMFQNLLPSIDLEPYLICDNHFPDDIDHHDTYLCTGSKYSVYDDIDWIKKLSYLLQEIHKLKKKFVGICFGHQMMAHALGGMVEKASEGWCIGAHTFEVISDQDWMSPSAPEHNVLMLCQDQVKQLPENSQVISTSNHCEIGMFTIGDHMLGIQAHPEFTKDYNQAIYEQRQERIGEEKVIRANDSLILPLHNETIGKWVMNFINHKPRVSH